MRRNHCEHTPILREAIARRAKCRCVSSEGARIPCVVSKGVTAIRARLSHVLPGETDVLQVLRFAALISAPAYPLSLPVAGVTQ
jgi:hypothetical protein